MIPNLELNLPRWVYASASKAFSDRIAQRLPLYFEGQERRTEHEGSFLEFRLDGPYVLELSKDYFRIDCEINILVVSQVDGHDHHKLYKDCGIALQCFKDPITIYRYGDGPDDNQSVLECMTVTRSSDQREAVRVSHFGKLDPNKPILQSSVEGHYHFFVIR